jgi:hypothetical protein
MNVEGEIFFILTQYPSVSGLTTDTGVATIRALMSILHYAATAGCNKGQIEDKSGYCFAFEGVRAEIKTIVQ